MSNPTAPEFAVNDVVWVVCNDEMIQTVVTQVIAYPAYTADQWLYQVRINKTVKCFKGSALYKNVDQLRKELNMPPLPKRVAKKAKKFVPPRLDEWIKYAETIGFERLEATNAYDHYVKVGWKVKGQSMKDWKAACRTCKARSRQSTTPTQRTSSAL